MRKKTLKWEEKEQEEEKYGDSDDRERKSVAEETVMKYKERRK